MGVLYMPFFDVTDSEHGLSTSITISTSGESDITLAPSSLSANDEDSNASSIFSHYLCTDITSFDPELVARFRHYARSSFTVAFELSVRAAMTLAGWPSPSSFNCDFSYITGLVTMSYTQTFSVSWPTWSNALIFGFTTPNAFFFPADLTGANSYTAQSAPTFCINSTLSDVSYESGVYEPEGLGNHVYNDTGGGNSLARTQAPQFNDWTQEFESNWRTYRVSGQYLLSPTATYTHQDLYRQCRKGFPFVLYGDDRVGVDVGKAEVYSLRSDGMSFHPQRATPGSGTQFHIPYRCHLEGIAT